MEEFTAWKQDSETQIAETAKNLDQLRIDLSKESNRHNQTDESFHRF